MVKTCLLDTGPIVAFLDVDDLFHEFVFKRLQRFHGEWVTTNAIISEAMYFARNMRRGPAEVARFVKMSRLRVFDSCQVPQLEAAAHLMKKYANISMDFADATLVYLADRTKCYDLLTLDRRDFSVYRTESGAHFNLVLGETGD